MRFCPECKSICDTNYRLRKSVCSRCGYVIDLEVPLEIKNTKIIDGKIVSVTNSLKSLNSLSRRKCLCPKCGNMEAYISIVGARNEDDYETEKYTCTECSHSWRESN